MEVYAADIEGKMQRFFGWLSEKDRRRYAAVEAAKLGHGGVEYIARVLACDPKTIRQGIHELEDEEDAAAGRIRKKGGTPTARSRAADPGSESPSTVAHVQGGVALLGLFCWVVGEAYHTRSIPRASQTRKWCSWSP